jgi:hypothetical protein
MPNGDHNTFSPHGLQMGVTDPQTSTPADKRFKNYIKQILQPMRPFEEGEDLSAQGVSVWDGDTPEIGGMVAVNPKDPADKWYAAKKFFEENYQEAPDHA